MENAVLPRASLYLEDETAWLETMSRLVAERRFQELDHDHLSEYLADMARRDKREVRSRLAVLIAHLLKWDLQSDQRTNSWRATIAIQRQELRDLLESATLLNHAHEILGTAYERAVKQAALDMGRPFESFASENSLTLDAILGDD